MARSWTLVLALSLLVPCVAAAQNQSIPPGSPQFRESYGGGSTQQRRPLWSWYPGPGGDVAYYTIATQGPGFALPTTWLSGASWTPSQDLLPGLHTFFVRAHNASGSSPIISDTVLIVLPPPPPQKVSLRFLAEGSTVSEQNEKVDIPFQLVTPANLADFVKLN